MLEKPYELFTEFALQVKKYPGNTCLIDNEQSITYEQALVKINRYAEQMWAKGITDADNVAIYSHKSIHAVLYFLALSKLGCDIITLDLAFPEKQCLFVLDDAKVHYILCETHFPHQTDVPVLNFTDLDQPAQKLFCYEKQSESHWVVYSSGTTGMPKGIRISELAMLNSFKKRDIFSPYDCQDVVAASIYFYWEVFRPLLNGASVLVLENQEILDFDFYSKTIQKHQVTETLWTPSFAELLTKTATSDQVSSLGCLRRVWLNGEVVSAYLFTQLKQVFPGIQFFNLYSISETFDVSAFELTSDLLEQSDNVPIGKPLKHTRLILLNEQGENCQVGEQGELYIGGNSLASGYLNQPQKQADSFVFLTIDGETSLWFKTKDTAFVGEDGQFYIMGRNDDIVKLRGYNISLLSIENVLKQTLSIQQCFVKLEEIGDERQIVAYIQPENSLSFIQEFAFDRQSGYSEALYELIRHSLPHYAVPNSFRLMDTIQFNAYSAKLVRESEQQNQEDCPIKAIWQQSLNLPNTIIQPHSNFFALGGTSLQAVKLVQCFNARFTHKITIQTIYQNPKFETFKLAVQGSYDHQTKNPLSQEMSEDLAWQPDITYQQKVMIPQQLNTAETIFLTGATGFLGAHWLHELINQTDARLICLVRAENDSAALARIKSRFQQYALPLDGLAQRVEVLAGDLSQPKFALPLDQWEALCHRTDLILHAAAHVNLMHGYDHLRPTILATQQILSMALSHHMKPCLLISSDAVYSKETVHQRNRIHALESVHQLTYGYAQTKWVQEQLIHKIAKAFGLPYIIVRLGNLAPSLLTNQANPLDLNGMFLSAVCASNFIPDEVRLEFCPVDRVVRVLTEIGCQPFSAQVLSLDSVNLFNRAQLCSHFNEHDLNVVSFPIWQKKIQDQHPELYGLSTIEGLLQPSEPAIIEHDIPDRFFNLLSLTDSECRQCLQVMASISAIKET